MIIYMPGETSGQLHKLFVDRYSFHTVITTHGVLTEVICRHCPKKKTGPEHVDHEVIWSTGSANMRPVLNAILRHETANHPVENKQRLSAVG